MAKSALALVLFLVAGPLSAHLLPVEWILVDSKAIPHRWVALPPSSLGPDLALVVPPLDRPAVLRWSGTVVLRTGDPTGQGKLRTLYSQAVMLESSPVSGSLFLDWYGPEAPSRGFQVGTRTEAQSWVWWRNALGPGLVGSLLVTAAVFVLALGLLAWFLRGKVPSLPFGAILTVNLCYLATWLNVVVSLPTVPEVPLVILNEWGLTGWSFSALVLALRLTGLGSRRWSLVLGLLGLAALPGALWLSLGTSPQEVVARYNQFVLPVNLGVDALSGAVAVLGVLRKPRWRTGIFLAMAIGSLAGMAADTWSLVVVGERPYFAFLPLVALALNLYFVVLFFWDSAQLYHDLERQVQARTQDLERFVGLLSHDLRNVLQGVNRVAEGLAAETPGASDPRLRLLLRDSTRESLAVLGNLLSLSHLRTGILRPQPRPTLVHGQWDGALVPWKTAAEERHLTWSVAPGPDRRVWVDEAMVQTILRNLVDNAVRHGPPHSTLALEVVDRNGSLVWALEGQAPWPEDRDPETLFTEARPRLGSDLGTSGFGLVLCRDLAERQGLTLQACRTRQGRLRFELEVPGKLVLPSEGENPPSTPVDRSSRVEA